MGVALLFIKRRYEKPRIVALDDSSEAGNALFQRLQSIFAGAAQWEKPVTLDLAGGEI
jgi:hypothetical protein